MATQARYGRFALADGTVAYARVKGDELVVLAGAPWLELRETGRRVPIAQAKRLCPVQPSKILCIGRNYGAHAKEMGAEVPKVPLLFLKPTSALLPPDGTVLIPPESERVEHEAELGVVLGQGGRRITPEQAMEHVFAYTVVGDITARDLQRSDGQWSRAKGFDTFCPVGPDLVTGVDPASLRVVGRVNGEIRQDGNTRDMMFDVAKLVSHLSQAMTLEPGDLIATGTPSGVGPLVEGDRFEAEVEGVGLLAVTVRKE